MIRGRFLVRRSRFLGSLSGKRIASVARGSSVSDVARRKGPDAVRSVKSRYLGSRRGVFLAVRGNRALLFSEPFAGTAEHRVGNHCGDQ